MPPTKEDNSPTTIERVDRFFNSNEMNILSGKSILLIDGGSLRFKMYFERVRSLNLDTVIFSKLFLSNDGKQVELGGFDACIVHVINMTNQQSISDELEILGQLYNDGFPVVVVKTRVTNPKLEEVYRQISDLGIEVIEYSRDRLYTEQELVFESLGRQLRDLKPIV